MSLIWYRFWYRVNKEGSGIDPLQSLWYQNNTSPERVNWGGKTPSPPPLYATDAKILQGGKACIKHDFKLCIMAAPVGEVVIFFKANIEKDLKKDNLRNCLGFLNLRVQIK